MNKIVLFEDMHPTNQYNVIMTCFDQMALLLIKNVSLTEIQETKEDLKKVMKICEMSFDRNLALFRKYRKYKFFIESVGKNDGNWTMTPNKLKEFIEVIEHLCGKNIGKQYSKIYYKILEYAEWRDDSEGIYVSKKEKKKDIQKIIETEENSVVIVGLKHVKKYQDFLIEEGKDVQIEPLNVEALYEEVQTPLKKLISKLEELGERCGVKFPFQRLIPQGETIKQLQ